MFARHPSGHLSDSVLLQFIDRDLPPARQSAADAHVAACGRCAARVRELDPSRTGAAAATSGDADLDHRRARARLVQAMARTRPAASSSFGLLRPRGLALAAFATAVVVCVIGWGEWRAARRSDARAQALALDHGPLPIAALTPGAVWDVSVEALCAGHAPLPQAISPSLRRDVLRAYRMEHVPEQAYELDYLITPELGGATDAKNLWPERYSTRTWNARVKDQLETLLPDLVCRGEVSLDAARRDIATDWIAAYQKYFKSPVPVGQTAGWVDDEPVFAMFDGRPTGFRLISFDSAR